MKDQKEFPKGITVEVLEEIYAKSHVVKFTIGVDIKVVLGNGDFDLIYSAFGGFDFCPWRVMKELIKRGLVPESELSYKETEDKNKGLLHIFKKMKPFYSWNDELVINFAKFYFEDVVKRRTNSKD